MAVLRVQSDTRLQAVKTVEPGAKVEYVVISQQPQKIVGPFGSNTGFDQPPVNAVWTDAPQYEQGPNMVWVRVTDIAGNQSFRKFDFTLDSEEPEAPTIKLHSSTTDSSSNLPLSDGRIDISALETGPDSAWEYSLDGGATWIIGTKTADTFGESTLNVTGSGVKSVLVRQFDSAGNVSAQSDMLTFTIAEPAPFEVRATDYGIEVKQNVSGMLLLSSNGSAPSSPMLFSGANAGNGWFEVQAPLNQATGVVGLVSMNSFLLDPKGTVYTLGTNADDMFTGSHVYGFGGSDILTGTDGDDFLSGGDGSDTIDGGLGDDTIVGGAGGDVITVSGGYDRIVIKDASESCLGFKDDELMFDQVHVESSDTIVFDFNADVTKAYDKFLDMHVESTIDELYLALNATYTAAAGTDGGAAVLMSNEDGLVFLVVDNGDSQIDDQDIVVQIIGADYGTIYADQDGNVGFNPFIN